MTEFMHSPWGRNHRVYRKDLGEPWGEVDWCDACGCEVFHAFVSPTPAAFLRYNSHEHRWGEWQLDETGFHTRHCDCGAVEWDQDEIDAESRARGLVD